MNVSKIVRKCSRDVYRMEFLWVEGATKQKKENVSLSTRYAIVSGVNEFIIVLKRDFCSF